jgi:hypothetical protein
MTQICVTGHQCVKSTTGNIPEAVTTAENTFTVQDKTDMDNSNVRGENMSYEGSMEGGWIKKEQPTGIKWKGIYKT